MIAASPCHEGGSPEGRRGRGRSTTLEEIEAVRAALGERWRAVVVTLAGSGLRIGELLGLEVSDVDFLRRTIRVERQRLQTGAPRPSEVEGIARTVPVGQVVIDALAAHLAAYPSDGALFLDEFGRAVRLSALEATSARCGGRRPACP